MCQDQPQKHVNTPQPQSTKRNSANTSATYCSEQNNINFAYQTEKQVSALLAKWRQADGRNNKAKLIISFISRSLLIKGSARKIRVLLFALQHLDKPFSLPMSSGMRKTLDGKRTNASHNKINYALSRRSGEILIRYGIVSIMLFIR